MSIDPELEANYDAIVADETRIETYKSIADNAEANAAPDLAAWARQRASKGGADVKPTRATADPDKVKRDGKSFDIDPKASK